MLETEKRSAERREENASLNDLKRKQRDVAEEKEREVYENYKESGNGMDMFAGTRRKWRPWASRMENGGGWK